MNRLQITAHPPTSPTRLLTSLLTLTSLHTPTTLLICTTKTAFLTSFLSSISALSSTQDGSANRLLHNTLEVLSIAPHIKVVYVPTLTHLRAWLSVAQKDARIGPSNQGQSGGIDVTGEAVGSKTKAGKLVVWGLVRAHQYTSEWSVQGLSESLAALEECGQRLEVGVVLVEPPLAPVEAGEAAGYANALEELRRMDEEMAEGEDFSEYAYSQPTSQAADMPMYGGDEEEEERGGEWGGGGAGDEGRVLDGHDGGVEMEEESEERRAEREREMNIYHARLPMLNGSSHREGFGEREGWSGRTVEVGVVMRRWVRFVRDEL